MEGTLRAPIRLTVDATTEETGSLALFFSKGPAYLSAMRETKSVINVKVVGPFGRLANLWDRTAWQNQSLRCGGAV